MTFLTGAVGNILSIVVMCMIVAGIMKVFQAVALLEEIKEDIKDMNRYRRLDESAGDLGQAGRGEPPEVSSMSSSMSMTGKSGDELLRELDRQVSREDQERRRWSEDALDPEIVEPGD